MSERVECVHADRCGGCPLIELPYDAQLDRKHGRVAAALARYPSLGALAVEAVAPADPIVGYRTRAKLVAGGGALGLFAKGGGHEVVDIPGCRVLAPPLAVTAAALRARIAADRASDGPLGALRAVDLREVRDDAGQSRVLVTLVVDRATARLEALAGAARALMAAAPRIAGVAANLHEGKGPQILGAETELLAGEARLPDRTGSSRPTATFGSFVQAHRGQAARIHALLEALVRPPARALDLYGGSGAIGLALAAAGARVTLVESFAPAAEQAAATARAQGLPLEAECADVAAALQSRAARGAERFDLVVVNPPRRGTSPKVREALARLAPAAVAYVSCDPDTLARDLAHLARLGYQASALRPLDMIPLTDEVETVAVLRPAAPAPARVLYEDDEVLAVDKGPHEPTVPQGEYAGSLLGRVRAVPGAEQAVALQRADVGASGVVLFARRAAFVARWEAALAQAGARATYLAATRGVTSRKGKLKGPPEVRYRRLGIAAGQSVLRAVASPIDPRRALPLRRELAATGHPLLGDDRHGHGPTNRHFEEKFGLDRAFLHAARIEVPRPDGRGVLDVEAPLAGDLAAVLDRAGWALPD